MSWRYTLTFPVINNARNVCFLASGEDKGAALRSVIEAPVDVSTFPLRVSGPSNGSPNGSSTAQRRARLIRLNI